LSIGSTATAFAQDATPEVPEAGAPTAGSDPAVGDTVSYIGSDGDEWAQVTVEEVIDPFEDYDPDFGEPERGNHFVALQITITATGDKAVEVSPYDILIQDEQGFLYGNSFISRTEEQEADAPEFEEANLAPGDEVSGLMFFQVIDDAQLSHIFWQPDSGRLVTIANAAS
jgi:hypothetical protein